MPKSPEQNFTPEQENELRKSRTLFAAELLEDGAEYDGENLIVTEQQKKEVKEEMDVDLGIEPSPAEKIEIENRNLSEILKTLKQGEKIVIDGVNQQVGRGKFGNSESVAYEVFEEVNDGGDVAPFAKGVVYSFEDMDGKKVVDVCPFRYVHGVYRYSGDPSNINAKTNRGDVIWERKFFEDLRK